MSMAQNPFRQAGIDHNRILEYLHNSVKGESFSVKDIIVNSKAFASSNSIKYKEFTYADILDYKNTYGTKSINEILALARRRNIITNRVEAVLDKFWNSVNVLTDEREVFYLIINYEKNISSTRYNDFEIQLLQKFIALFQSSYLFWTDHESFMQYTDNDEVVEYRKCKLFCKFCLVIQDAVMFLITDDPIAAAAWSAITRCCICGKCGNVGCWND